MSEATPEVSVDDAHEEGDRAPLMEHIRELRNRIIRSLAVVFLAVIAAWFFHEEFFAWLTAPYTTVMNNHHQELQNHLEYRALTEPLVVYFKASGIVGLLAATPYVLLELWRFVVPGLYKEERSMAGGFLVATLLFFFGGVLFARYLVLGPAIRMLLSIGAENTTAAIMMNEYFGFTARMLFVFGLLFELPVAISFLSALGLVTHRILWKYWHHAVVIIFLIGAILTPPDMVTQCLLAVPLTILYFVSLGVAWFFTTRRERKLAKLMEE